MMDLSPTSPAACWPNGSNWIPFARTETWFKVRAWSQRGDGGLEVEFTLDLAQGAKVEAVLVYPVFYPGRGRICAAQESWGSVVRAPIPGHGRVLP